MAYLDFVRIKQIKGLTQELLELENRFYNSIQNVEQDTDDKITEVYKNIEQVVAGIYTQGANTEYNLTHLLDGIRTEFELPYYIEKGAELAVYYGGQRLVQGSSFLVDQDRIENYTYLKTFDKDGEDDGPWTKDDMKLNEETGELELVHVANRNLVVIIPDSGTKERGITRYLDPGTGKAEFPFPMELPSNAYFTLYYAGLRLINRIDYSVNTPAGGKPSIQMLSAFGDSALDPCEDRRLTMVIYQQEVKETNLTYLLPDTAEAGVKTILLPDIYTPKTKFCVYYAGLRLTKGVDYIAEYDNQGRTVLSFDAAIDKDQERQLIVVKDILY